MYGRDKKTYIFNGEYFYILHEASISMGVEEGPILTSAKFKDLTRVDAVFRRPADKGDNGHGKIVFFHGDM